MSSKKNTTKEDQLVSPDGTFNLLKLTLVIVKRWLFVVIFFFTGGIIAIIYSGLIKEQFKSHVEIEFRSGDFTGLGNIINQFGFTKNIPDLILPNDITIADLIAHVARTPRIIDNIIEKNNLKKVFKIPSRTGVRGRFLSKVNIHVNDLGLLEISFKDQDKKIAYDVVISYIEEIEEYFRWKSKKIKDFSLKEAETSIQQIKNELFEAKIKLKEFQTEFGIFNIELYAEQLAEHISELQLQLIQANISYQIKKEEYNKLGIVTEREVRVYRENINIIERELYGLKNISKNSHVAYNDLPEINIKYMEVFTNVNSLTLIYEQLRLLYNTAKLNIDQENEAFIVVNKPEIAEEKFYPYRSRVVIIFTLLCFSIAIFLCFVFDFFERAFMSENDKRLLLQIKEHLSFWKKDKEK